MPWFLRGTLGCDQGFAEIPFIAADACGRDTIFTAVKSVLPRRVLLSGFHGGAVWAISPSNKSSDFARTDNAGLSQTEFRLQVGYIHCPVPMLGARQRERIMAISQSSEMRQMDHRRWL